MTERENMLRTIHFFFRILSGPHFLTGPSMQINVKALMDAMETYALYYS